MVITGYSLDYFVRHLLYRRGFWLCTAPLKQLGDVAWCNTLLIMAGLVLSLIGFSDVACTGSSVTEKTVPMFIVGIVSLVMGFALRSDDSVEGHVAMKEKVDRDS